MGILTSTYGPIGVMCDGPVVRLAQWNRRTKQAVTSAASWDYSGANRSQRRQSESAMNAAGSGDPSGANEP